jgi:N4-(beta-N-acetylglucosaminyl)-L-asparaginase
MSDISRRDWLRATAAAGVAATVPSVAHSQGRTGPTFPSAPNVIRSAVKPLVIADYSGYEFRNGGATNAVEKAFDLITKGSDVLDALVAGVNIPELDPLETGIGYGGLPNADGVVQLDASCMHGPLRRAGAVASIEGVRTPSIVAKMVADRTDHHLLVGKGAQDFARSMGVTIEADLNTPRSRELWLEWKRRIDPDHYLDPTKRPVLPPPPPLPGRGRGGAPQADRRPTLDRQEAWYRAGLSMVRDGLIREGSFWGTINCNGINARGDICGVTTTSGLSWKIPGRVGDSPILGAGLYVDNDVGAAGSTGRGEANLYNLSSFLIVESMRRGMSPKDAGMEALRRIRSNTVEQRLRNARGEPNFNIRFFILNKNGEHAGVSMYAAGETRYALCSERGAEAPAFEAMLPGAPTP